MAWGVRSDQVGYVVRERTGEASMTNTEGSERDTMNVGQPEEAELADEELGQEKPARIDKIDKPDEDKAEDELELLEGGAETIADLDEEAGQTNRPGTERPPV
jgi:hypothetical protein